MPRLFSETLYSVDLNYISELRRATLRCFCRALMCVITPYHYVGKGNQRSLDNICDRRSPQLICMSKNNILIVRLLLTFIMQLTSFINYKICQYSYKSRTKVRTV